MVERALEDADSGTPMLVMEGEGGEKLEPEQVRRQALRLRNRRLFPGLADAVDFLNSGAGGGSVRLVGALRDDGLALGNVSSLVDAQEGR